MVRPSGSSRISLPNQHPRLDPVAALVAQDPGNAEWQRDLLVSRFKIGDTLLRLGAVTGAQRSAEAALAIARDRASRFPDHADSVRDLRAAEGLMRRIEAAVKAGVQ